MGKVKKTANVEERHEEYLDKTALNFSKFIRIKLDERMKEDGFDVE